MDAACELRMLIARQVLDKRRNDVHEPEDETEFQCDRRPICCRKICVADSALLMIEGILQNQDNVIHIRAEKFRLRVTRAETSRTIFIERASPALKRTPSKVFRHR